MGKNIILVEKREKITILTLNRPEVMNAFNMAMLGTLKDKVETIRSDRKNRVVIITGAGEKSFCVGADLEERVTLNDDEVMEYVHAIRDIFTSIESLDRPVIAAINGVALGGGTELALSCDIRLASVNATMGLTETLLAVIPGAGGTQRLPRLIGSGMAKEMIFTGKKVGAEEALRIGLINRVCERDTLIEECLKVAIMICEAGPIAIQQAKYAINAGLNADLGTGLDIESDAYRLTIPTRDRLEGLAAFFEKRKPVYEGK